MIPTLLVEAVELGINLLLLGTIVHFGIEYVVSGSQTQLH